QLVESVHPRGLRVAGDTRFLGESLQEHRRHSLRNKRRGRRRRVTCAEREVQELSDSTDIGRGQSSTEENREYLGGRVCCVGVGDSERRCLASCQLLIEDGGGIAGDDADALSVVHICEVPGGRLGGGPVIGAAHDGEFRRFRWCCGLRDGHVCSFYRTEDVLPHLRESFPLVTQFDRIDSERPTSSVEPKQLERLAYVVSTTGRKRCGGVVWRTDHDETFDCCQGVESWVFEVILAVGGRFPTSLDRVVAQLEQVVGGVPGVVGKGPPIPRVVSLCQQRPVL